MTQAANSSGPPSGTPAEILTEASAAKNGDVQALLKHPPFQSFWSARILSTLAVQIQTVAVGWQVYDLTRSAFALGMIGLVQFAPAILLTLVVGQVADRYNRRWIIRICQTLACCIALILAIGSYHIRIGICVWYRACV